jgi:NAD(P)-dependent dehydrogenase (short-subunit alcohol dehydrogenase family)
MPADFKGQAALLTGASRGMGRAIAVPLSAAGADSFIILHFRRRSDALEQLQKELPQAVFVV